MFSNEFFICVNKNSFCVKSLFICVNKCHYTAI